MLRLPIGFSAGTTTTVSNCCGADRSPDCSIKVDLIALLLRRADEERIANAIRARSNPRGGFLQALIADEDEADFRRGHGADPGARPTPQSPRSTAHRVRGPVLTRLAQFLVYAVAASPSSESARNVASKEGHLPFGNGALRTPADPATHGKAVDKSHDRRWLGLLSETGYLDERILEAAAEEGDVAFLAIRLGRARRDRRRQCLGLSRRR